MHIKYHFLINILFGILCGLSLKFVLLLGLGGILIDLDHVFYYVFFEKKRKIRDMHKWHLAMLKIHSPRFYFLHTIEVIGALLLASYSLNSSLFYLFLGFAVHLAADDMVYIWYYRSLKPWAKYQSLIYYSRKFF